MNCDNVSMWILVRQQGKTSVASPQEWRYKLTEAEEEMEEKEKGKKGRKKERRMHV